MSQLIKISCPNCNGLLGVRPKKIGTTAKCPRCNTEFKISSPQSVGGTDNRDAIPMGEAGIGLDRETFTEFDFSDSATPASVAVSRFSMSRLKGMDQTKVNTIMAGAALVISVLVAILHFTSRPLGRGLDHYSFSTPLDAYKSMLEIELNNDVLAKLELIRAIDGPHIQEELETLSVDHSRDHEGKTLLFATFNQDGVPKRKVIVMQRDAMTGYWQGAYVSPISVENSNERLAEEMREWSGEE